MLTVKKNVNCKERKCKCQKKLKKCKECKCKKLKNIKSKFKKNI